MLRPSPRPLLPVLLLLLAGACTSPRSAGPRPAAWAAPVVAGELENLHRLADGVYRCEQPDDDDFRALASLGIRSVLNLREHHDDADEAAGSGLVLHHLRWDTRSVTTDQLVEALIVLRDAPPPVVVHCWHGSDRTGTVCAAWRIVFQDWTVEAALDEMLHGGYGFHPTFANLPRLLRQTDWETVRRRVLPAPAASGG